MAKQILNQGYGIMPNEVLFDEELPSTAKLLFCYLSSLCATTGYAWASNPHLAKKFSISERSVSRHIDSLSGKGYIDVTDGNNHLRKVYIGEGSKQISLDKNVQPPRQKCLSSLDKNVYHNSISVNNTSRIKKDFYKNDKTKQKNLRKLAEMKQGYGIKA